MDALAVAIASSIILKGPTWRSSVRLSFHFGLFQALMPILGWALGSSIQEYIQQWDHWVAFGLLTIIGGKALIGAFSKEEDQSPADPTKGASLVVLSVATSIDALAVGLSFAMLNLTIWFPVVIIGLVAGAMTLIGMRVGSRLGALFGKRMEAVGGLVLLGIGLKILFEHLLG